MAKKCSNCKIIKEDFEFYYNKKATSKLTSWCKECSAKKHGTKEYKEYCKNYYDKNKELISKKSKEFYQKNRELILFKNRKNNRTLNSRYLQYKTGAKKRNLSFKISKKVFQNFTEKNQCYYCGINDIDCVKGYLGIDRKDNNIGYEINNLVSCCYECNKMKHNHTEESFKKLIIKIYNNMKLYDKSN